MDQLYTEILLGFALVIEGTTHLDDQMAYLEREIMMVIIVRVQTLDSYSTFRETSILYPTLLKKENTPSQPSPRRRKLEEMILTGHNSALEAIIDLGPSLSGCYKTTT